MFSKKPSFDESPLQDLSEDQMNQVAGGSDSSYKNSWNWKHHHHHHHHKMKNNTVKVEVIVVVGGKKYTYWEDASSKSKW